jgi:5-methylcytosine-specific restriction endonuclease McrA
MCEEKTKACSKCGEEKPLTEYNKDKRKKDGLRRFCRVCEKAYYRKYREENRGKARTYRKKWKKENREKVRADKRKWAKGWRERNPDAAKARRKKYYQENPEKIKAYDKKWREDNPGYYKKWLENNREKVRLYRHRRRALLLEATTEHFTHEDLLDFWSENEINYKECFYCEKEMSEGPEHIDHYYPLSKGGPHERANLRPSCAQCNLSKHAKQPETFMEELNNGL